MKSFRIIVRLSSINRILKLVGLVCMVNHDNVNPATIKIVTFRAYIEEIRNDSIG